MGIGEGPHPRRVHGRIRACRPGGIGPYSLECTSACNGRDQAAAYMITDSGLRQIAARRTVEDFVANERYAADVAAE